MDKFNGPIPGENYTSDTKNYSWHRPPEYDDLDLAIDYIGKKLTKEESAVGLLTMIEAGIPITDLTQTFIMSGIGNGKWTLDFGLLLAGPVAHIMVILAKSYGLKYELGIEDGISSKPPTSAFFKVVKEINRAKAAAAGRDTIDQLDDIETDTGEVLKKGVLEKRIPPTRFKSFMKAEDPNAQESMLGSAPETPEAPEEGI